MKFIIIFIVASVAAQHFWDYNIVSVYSQAFSELATAIADRMN